MNEIQYLQNPDSNLLLNSKKLLQTWEGTANFSRVLLRQRCSIHDVILEVCNGTIH